MKKFSLGFISAILITCTLSVQAEIKEYILHLVDYKVMVDGNEYTDSELPILNYEGNTYVPLKKVGDLLDVNVEWNNELYQVEIGDNNSLHTLQNFEELSVGDTFDNENAKITYNSLKKAPIPEHIQNNKPYLLEQVLCEITIELDENTLMQNTLWTGYYITDNEKYNTPESRIPIEATGMIDYGETKTFNLQYYIETTTDYNIKKAVLSFPSLGIENLVFNIEE